ncbi:MAG: hypothetical protein ACYS99_20105, partial [Planctomycetota bacterium]
MILSTEDSVQKGGLLDLVGPEVREELDRSHDILDGAARLRAQSWQHEDPIREWETRVRSEVPKGGQWRALLRECAEVVGEAADHHQMVRDSELEALPRLGSAIGLLQEASRVGREIPARSVELLGDCLRTREACVRVLEKVIALSARISDLTPADEPEEVLDLLDERRRLLGDASALKLDSDQLERRALYLYNEPPPALDKAAQLAIESEESAEGLPVWAELALAEGDGADWESWIKKLDEELSKRNGAEASEAETSPGADEAEDRGVEATPRTEDDEDWEREVERAIAEPAKRAATASEPATGQTPTKRGSSVLNSVLAGRVDLLAGELAAARLTAQKEVERLEAEIRRLEVEHAADLDARDHRDEEARRSERLEELDSLWPAPDRREDVDLFAKAYREHELELELEQERRRERATKEAEENLHAVEEERDVALKLVSTLCRRGELASIKAEEMEEITSFT